MKRKASKQESSQETKQRITSNLANQSYQASNAMLAIIATQTSKLATQS
jgi:hypothetical protein